MASSNSVVLVTGASGYIASYIVKLLQEEGWNVRGTVRNLENEQVVKQLKELVPNAKYPLELVEADLLKEDSWKEAVRGVTHVIHVASPFPDRIPSNPDELIKPAVEGTLAVLKAASEAGSVKRVVLTSSIAAVYDSSIAIPKDREETKTFTEEDWTDHEDPLLEPYAKSKTLAEKAAWDFVKELSDEKKFELVAINPGMVIGPLLTKRYTTSHLAIKKLLDKSTPAVARLKCNITDVRDVAQAHVAALTIPEAAGQRHLIVNHSVWIKDMALIIQKEFKPKGYFVPTFTAPNLLVRVSSIYDKGVKLVVPRLGKEVKYDNKRMQEVLKVTPIELEKTIIDTANSFIEEGIIKKSKKSQKVEGAEQAKGNGEAAPEGGKELEPEDKEKSAVAESAPADVAATN